MRRAGPPTRDRHFLYLYLVVIRNLFRSQNTNEAGRGRTGHRDSIFSLLSTGQDNQYFYHVIDWVGLKRKLSESIHYYALYCAGCLEV